MSGSAAWFESPTGDSATRTTSPSGVAMDWNVEGKTVLFTGASRGMGRFAAIELARRGAEVLVVGHHDARGAAAVDAIRDTGGTAEFLRADMGDAEDVCAVAEAVLARHGSIDASTLPPRHGPGLSWAADSPRLGAAASLMTP